MRFDCTGARDNAVRRRLGRCENSAEHTKNQVVGNGMGRTRQLCVMVDCSVDCVCTTHSDFCFRAVLMMQYKKLYITSRPDVDENVAKGVQDMLKNTHV